jgi:excinuclease ABC subunit C
MNKFKEKLKNLPKQPGVYQFLDANGKVVYIGKAKNLRSRVAQYFGKNDGRPQIPFLMAEAANINYTVVNSELESLYLENTLIKQHHPKYNILLMDDKNYAFIKID